MARKSVKYVLAKIVLHALLRFPDFALGFLFKLAYPIYKKTHEKRAWGRTQRHLEKAQEFLEETNHEKKWTDVTPRDVFQGIFWNALDSYRGLARFKQTTSRLVFENENIIKEALTHGPVAAISIHQGSFELLHRSLCRYSNNVHLVTDTLGEGALRQLIQELRSDPHLTEYSPEDSRALIRNLFKTNGILAMVFDQGKNTKGNKVKLFGQDSTLYLRLPELVNQMGAGIVTFRTFTRTSDNEIIGSQNRREIVIRFEKYYPPEYDKALVELHAKNSSNKKESDAPLVESIAKEVETWIAEHPAQWSWNYHGNFKV